MLLMQRPLRIVSGLKSEPPATKAKDVALSPPRITTMKGLQWPHSDHAAAYGTHVINSAEKSVCAQEGRLVMTRLAWMTH
jgi:hypothetical protein